MRTLVGAWQTPDSRPKEDKDPSPWFSPRIYRMEPYSPGRTREQTLTSEKAPNRIRFGAFFRVDLTWTYSNRLDLADLLERTARRVRHHDPGVEPTHAWAEDRRPSVTTRRPAEPRRVADRLGEEGVHQLLRARERGAKLADLAAQFGMSVSSVQRLLVRPGGYGGRIASQHPSSPSQDRGTQSDGDALS